MTVSLPGYVINETIHASGYSKLFRATSQREGDAVIVRFFTFNRTSPPDLARFRQEYQRLISTSLEGLPRIRELVQTDQGIGVVQEDFNGVPMAHLLTGPAVFSLKTFLDLAMAMSHLMGELHSRDLVHLGLSPYTILLSEDKTTFLVTDFGISDLITHATENLYDPEAISRILPYLSPEQTGRMNRTVDYRSDLYSLGVVFYAMLAGQPPFTAQDPMALIHAHIAVEPTPLDTLAPQVPSVIAMIIRRLLSKDPENRYQNAFGLMADLEQCRDQLEQNGEITPFALAENDRSPRFIIPQKLFGRDREIDVLLSYFEKAAKRSRGSTMILVSGPPGIGKSSLVQHVRPLVLQKNGYYISGKFEQLHQDMPYTAMADAIREWVKQILTEQPEKILAWRSALLTELGVNAGSVCGIIPDLALIIGEQAAQESLGPEQTKHRFNYVFNRFIRLIASGDHPLTLFLDDAQWADPSSLELLQHILSGGGPGYFYVILSFRDNEVGVDHALARFAGAVMQNEDTSVNTLSLSSLSEKDIGHLIVGFLKCTRERAQVLSRIVHEKTGGNPFFVQQLLYTLHETKMIEFHPARGWHWNDEDVQSAHVTENLLELMEERIARLPLPTLDMLKICACFGNGINYEHLANVSGKTLDDTLRHVKPALDEGYLKMAGGLLHHQHDRIQEAAYRQIPKDERPWYHYRIGKRLLLMSESPRDRQENLFNITDQLNLARPRIVSDEDRLSLRTLNFEAGVKAKASAAYGPAGVYFENALSFLDERSWSQEYDTTLAIHEECADCACLNGRYGRLADLSQIITEKARSIFDRVRLTEINIRAHSARQNYDKAVAGGMEFLKELGFSLPQRVSKRHILVELIRVKRALRPLSDQDILNLPEMTDSTQKAIARIINSLGAPASLTSSNLYGFMILKRMQMGLTYGKNPYMGIGFTAYGGFLISALGDIEGGIRYGDLSLIMSDRHEGKMVRQRILVTYDLYIRHWKEPIRQCQVAARQSISSALEAGDQHYTGVAYAYGDFLAMITEKDLTTFWDLIHERYKITLQNLQQSMIQMHGLALQWLTNVLGKNQSLLPLSGDFFDEASVVPGWIEKKNIAGLAHYYTMNMSLHFMSYDIEGAYQNLLKALDHRALVKAMLINHLLTWYDPLVRLAYCHRLSGRNRRQMMGKARSVLKRIRRWDSIEPSKNQPWIHLIEAEMAWLKGQDMKAQELYDHAILGFDQAPAPMFKAMALERAAMYFREKNRTAIAGLYVRESLSIYEDLGIKAKAMLMREYWNGGYFREDSSRWSLASDGVIKVDTSSRLDYGTVIQSALAISGEIKLGRLIERIMHLAMENAGARNGFLILMDPDTGESLIKASGKTEGGIEVFDGLPVEDSSGLSRQVVNYVLKTGEPVILDNAALDSRFNGDPYVAAQKPKSVLCIPIRHQGLVTGILYLENNLTTAAFSSERVKLLDLLMSQAAISLENARLFTTIKKTEQELRELNLELEKRVKERTLALNQSLEKVEDAHRQFLSSLNYSRVIQSSLLPDQAKMATRLKDSFALWQPRDIIGGDMFFFEVLEKGFILAVIDCTGHGVPGAFMTMVASSGFRRIVTEDGEQHPARILEKLNRYVRNALHQDGPNPLSNDGLDAAICHYDRSKDILSFSGAGLPLYAVSKDDVAIIKGDRHHLGYVHSDPGQTFETVTLEHPDRETRYYLMTDGFPDQLGYVGKERQRFGTQRLKKVLLDGYPLPLSRQKTMFLDQLNLFKVNHPQNDDITIVGFELPE